MATTAGGLWKAASFEGGGISDASQHAYEQQFRKPHTGCVFCFLPPMWLIMKTKLTVFAGMVYTPPQYSDHIGIALLLQATAGSSPVSLNRNKATRAAQPHLKQMQLTNFFSKPAASKPCLPPSSPSNTTLQAPTEQKLTSDRPAGPCSPPPVESKSESPPPGRTCEKENF